MWFERNVKGVYYSRRSLPRSCRTAEKPMLQAMIRGQVSVESEIHFERPVRLRPAVDIG